LTTPHYRKQSCGVDSFPFTYKKEMLLKLMSLTGIFAVLGTEVTNENKTANLLTLKLSLDLYYLSFARTSQ